METTIKGIQKTPFQRKDTKNYACIKIGAGALAKWEALTYTGWSVKLQAFGVHLLEFKNMVMQM